MPIRFEVHYRDSRFDTLVAWIEIKNQEVVVPNPGKKAIDFVLFDPGRNVVKKVTFDKGFENKACELSIIIFLTVPAAPGPRTGLFATSGI